MHLIIDQSFPEVLRAANERGVIIVNCTQCMRGRVKPHYVSYQSLSEVGVISGHDLTPESALMKLAYLLSRRFEYRRCKTCDANQYPRADRRSSAIDFFRERAFISSVAQIFAYHAIFSDVEGPYPVLMCAAVANDEVEALIRMVEEAQM